MQNCSFHLCQFLFPLRELAVSLLSFKYFILPCMIQRNGIFLAISVNKGCHQVCSPSTWAGEPKGNSGKKEYLPCSSHQTKATAYVSLEESQDVTRQGLAPDTWGAYQENDFSEPRLLHHPTYRKALNSLTWGIWFSIINSNILTFRLPALCCKTPIYYGSPLRLLRAILLGLPEMLPPRLEVLKSPT